MPRAARNVKLETRSARAKLSARRAPYFLKVAKGLRLGYYRTRGSSAGTWIGRRYLGDRQYETTALGIADDTTSADNVAVFDFWQAQDALRRWGEVDGWPITASSVRAPIRSGPPSRITWLKSPSKSAHRR